MAKASQTINPLHFEDLEPHRFEDLVRELIYDFKDWQSLEATGRAGSDDGFDVRAWEKLSEITNQSEEENEEGIHPMEGNLWMIQCKREKELGPKRINEIIKETTKDKAPYGYLLVAPVNFSKKSYDAFREELIKKGVMEFHLWGKAELEDMLYMPKNDRILFTFFGISLVIKKRTKVREVKFALNNKNKLIRILGVSKMYTPLLIRDIDAENYPFKAKYKDFKEKPQWSVRMATHFHPLGLMFELRKYYAYIDTEKKEFDVVDSTDLIVKIKGNGIPEPEEDYDLKERIEDYWEHLPIKNQGKFVFEGLLHFDDMLIIDEKGDVVYDFPHIFVDGKAFKWTWEKIEIGNTEIDVYTEKYKRIKYFPSTFLKGKKGKIHEDKTISFAKHDYICHVDGKEYLALFDLDNTYTNVNIRDYIPLQKGPSEQSSSQEYLEVTHIYKIKVSEFIKDASYLKGQIDKQVGRESKLDEELTVLEVKNRYEWSVKNR